MSSKQKKTLKKNSRLGTPTVLFEDNEVNFILASGLWILHEDTARAVIGKRLVRPVQDIYD
jgi:hypothetical protein